MINCVCKGGEEAPPEDEKEVYSMSINIIAILVSLAMMLTGASPAAMPAEASRTLRVSDIVVSFGDEEIALDPELVIGAYTDGAQALFSLGLEAGDYTLFPTQLSADEERVALAIGGQAVGIPAQLLNSLAEQAQQMVESSVQADETSAQILSYLKDEYIPAITALVAAASDPERQAEIQEKATAVFAELVDRGEGTEDTVTLGDGTEYAVTRYHYTIDFEQATELADAIYQCDEALANFYAAMMKLYAMMPEESGLNGITSFSDLSEMLDIDMTMEMDEAISEADDLDMVDAVMTMVIPPQVMEAPEGEEPQTIELPPMVYTIAAYKLGEYGYAEVAFDYAFQGNGVTFHMTSEESDAGVSADMDMQVAEGDSTLFELGMEMEGYVDPDTGDAEFDMDCDLEAQDTAFSFGLEGVKSADGTGACDVAMDVEANGVDAGLEFTLTLSDGTFDSLFDGADVLMIEDLSQEGLNALMQDTGVQGRLLQVVGSLQADFGRLMADESVQQLTGLISAGMAEED